ncbi:hypothetical protein PHET_02174 [Paragonimus heterotremus]|uniref:Uncharacterized protein n=1 Tax=Paragonimus heterotremus TaxID=100268 RepID=A0A8J4TQQ0_9TREM|nr:hypothetical protein PHET_02174 [Paragonimus heterotremus]
MERQFNQNHGANTLEFYPGDPVYILKLHDRRSSWVPGTVAQRRGHVLYELSVYGKYEMDYIIHIRRRDPNICDRWKENLVAETRHSRRTRAPVEHLNVGPSKRSSE